MLRKSAIIFLLSVFIFEANFCFSFDIRINKKDTTQKLSGFYMGVSFGSYFANKNTAGFYNGSGVNNLKAAIIGTPYNYQAIRQNFDGKDFFVDTNSLPKNMKYDAAISVGFHIRKIFKNQISFFLESYYSKLKAADYITIVVDDHSTQISEPVIRKYPIIGQEERLDLNLGISKTFTNKKINPYFEFGVNMNNVKVLKSEVQIEGLTYSIVSYNNAYYNISQGGIGFGLFAGTGLEMILNKKLFLNVGANFSYKKIHLGDNDKYFLNTIIYTKLILSGLLFFGENSN
ncbi:MAG: hypothetical protein WC223_00510 [Bacteroidales bacterium]|jgi:hypothetical protein